MWMPPVWLTGRPMEVPPSSEPPTLRDETSPSTAMKPEPLAWGIVDDDIRSTTPNIVSDCDQTRVASDFDSSRARGGSNDGAIDREGTLARHLRRFDRTPRRRKHPYRLRADHPPDFDAAGNAWDFYPAGLQTSASITEPPITMDFASASVPTRPEPAPKPPLTSPTTTMEPKLPIAPIRPLFARSSND